MADENPKIGADAKPKQFGNRGMGRPKGATNKTSRLMKEAALIAAEAAGQEIAQLKAETNGTEVKLVADSGLVTYLKEQAIHQPASFMSILGKVITAQQQDEERGINIVQTGPRTITIDIGYIEHGPFKAIEHAG